MKRTSWITWRIYFVTIPIDVIVLILSGDHYLKSWNDVFAWGLVSIFAHTVLLPFVAFGILQSEKIRNWKFDLIFLLILGAIRGTAITFCIAKYNLELNVSFAYKIFNSTIALPQWFVGVALFIESKKQYQETFRQLFSKAMLKEQEGSEKTKILPNSNTSDEVIARIQFITSNLSSELKNLLSQPQTLSEYGLEGSKIKNLIEQEIRPATSNLWKASKIKSPKIPLKKLLQISLLENKLPVFLVVTISSPYLFVGINGINGSKNAFFQCLQITLIHFIVFMVFELLLRKMIINRVQANLCIILFSFLVGLLIQLEYTAEPFKFSNNQSVIIIYQIFLSINYVILLLAINGYNLIKDHQKRILESLEKYLQGDKFQNLISGGLQAQKQTDLAQYLHGEVQAGLTASSLLLQRAAESGDSVLAQEALERASGLLDLDFANISYTRMAPPELKIRKMIEAWKGIADISIDLPAKDQFEDYVLRNAVKLIEEAVSNAIRHAKADVIKVSGVLKLNVLTITVISNGDSMAKGKAGLGTQLFDDLSSEWNYASESGHNRLTFTLLNQ